MNQARMGAVAAVILAAGRASRFAGGEAATKVVAELAGKPLVRHVAEAALAARVRPIIVVAGHAAHQTAAALEGCGVRIVQAEDYAAGLAHSLRAGLAAVPPAATGALILLGDMPLISIALIDKLIDTFERNADAAAIVPAYAGRRGNPVLLGRKIFPLLEKLTGDRGAGQILRDMPGVIEVPVTDAAVTADIDTLDDLQRLSDSKNRIISLRGGA